MKSILIFDIITADDYEYNADLDLSLDRLKTMYDNLTDDQKKLQTTSGNLEIAINKQVELKNIELNNKYKRIAQQFIDDFDQLLTDKIKVDNYLYTTRIDANIEDIVDEYNNLSDDVKDKLLVDFDFKFEFDRGLNQRECNNSSRGDVASLAGNYCRVSTRASQFSPTTRNLVPRFKRWGKGCLRDQGCIGESGFNPVERWVVSIKSGKAVTSCKVTTARHVRG